MERIIKVTVQRFEGRSDPEPKEFPTMAAADGYLHQIALSAPKGGGYDKTEVVIYWADGCTWKDRFDVKYIGEPNNDISVEQHYRSQASFFRMLLITVDPEFVRRREYFEAEGLDLKKTADDIDRALNEALSASA